MLWFADKVLNSICHIVHSITKIFSLTRLHIKSNGICKSPSPLIHIFVKPEVNYHSSDAPVQSISGEYYRNILLPYYSYFFAYLEYKIQVLRWPFDGLVVILKTYWSFIELKPPTGFEPATNGLQKRCSTTELQGQQKIL